MKRLQGPRTCNLLLERRKGGGSARTPFCCTEEGAPCLVDRREEECSEEGGGDGRRRKLYPGVTSKRGKGGLSGETPERTRWDARKKKGKNSSKGRKAQTFSTNLSAKSVDVINKSIRGTFLPYSIGDRKWKKKGGISPKKGKHYRFEVIRKKPLNVIDKPAQRKRWDHYYGRSVPCSPGRQRGHRRGDTQAGGGKGGKTGF